MSKPHRRFFYFAHRSFKITLCCHDKNKSCRAVVERKGVEVADLFADSKDEALSAAKAEIDRLYESPEARA